MLGTEVLRYYLRVTSEQALQAVCLMYGASQKVAVNADQLQHSSQAKPYHFPYPKPGFNSRPPSLHYLDHILWTSSRHPRTCTISYFALKI